MAELFVDAAGDGPAIALVHGLAGSGRNWRRQLRALRPHWRAVAYDVRGHARSEAPRGAGAYRLEALVTDLVGVLDAAVSPGASAVVGGLSLGALVALETARRHPERVRGLVLASPPGPGGIGAAAEAFAAAIEVEGLEAAGARFVWGPESGLDAHAARMVRAGFLEHAPHALAGLLRETLAGQPPLQQLAGDLAARDLPVLVVAGERDPESLETARRMAAALPRATLRVIPEAGHVVNLAQPELFDAELGGFLAREGLGPAPRSGSDAGAARR